MRGVVQEDERAPLRGELAPERRVEGVDVEAGAPSAPPANISNVSSLRSDSSQSVWYGPQYQLVVSSAWPGLEEVRDGVAERAGAAGRRGRDGAVAERGLAAEQVVETARRNSGVPAIGAYAAHSAAGTSCTARAAAGEDGELAVVVEQRADGRVHDRLALLPLRCVASLLRAKIGSSAGRPWCAGMRCIGWKQGGGGSGSMGSRRARAAPEASTRPRTA